MEEQEHHPSDWVRRPGAESRSRLGAVGIAMAHCLSGLEASAYLFRQLLQDGRCLPLAGWATKAHGPLECYRDFRQKYARATSQPFRRAAGVFATSTRATGARLKLCQAQAAVGRFPAESYSLPIPSLPLQPLRPHNARTRARTRPNWNQAVGRSRQKVTV